MTTWAVVGNEVRFWNDGVLVAIIHKDQFPMLILDLAKVLSRK